MHSILDPIPLLPKVTTGTPVETLGVDEPMVNICEHGGGLIRCDAHAATRAPARGQAQAGGSADTRFLVRRDVAERILRARAHLPLGLHFTVIDAWRSRDEQTRIFEDYAAELCREHPDWPEDRVREETSLFVTDPAHDAPPHCTGGAVDVVLTDDSGACVEFGTDYDDFSPKAATRYFEEAIAAGETPSEKDLAATNNRRILFHCLAREGLTNYPGEWWHFDYGDAFWAQVTGEPALYGVAEAVDAP
jgi:D-alanyl-D-alanine dipeptidase